VQQGEAGDVGGVPQRAVALDQRGRADRHHGFGEQHLGLRVGIAARPVADGEIDIGDGEIDEAHIGRDPDLDVGVQGLEALQPWDQPFDGEGGGDRDRDALAAQRQAHDAGGVAQARHRGGDMDEGRRAGVGQLDPSAEAAEERLAGELLHLLDVLADGGGADAQFVGGARETEMPPGGLEGPQRVERRQAEGRVGVVVGGHGPPLAHAVCRAYIGCVVNQRKEVIQCLIARSRVCRPWVSGLSPPARTAAPDLKAPKGPDRIRGFARKGPSHAGRPFLFAAACLRRPVCGGPPRAETRNFVSRSRHKASSFLTHPQGGGG